MTTFSKPDSAAAERAAIEAERSNKRVKFGYLKNPDFARNAKRKLGRPTRVLPPVASDLPWQKVKKHELRNPYAADSNMVTGWACPKAHGGGRCILCELEKAARASNDRQMADMLQVNEKNLVFVLNPDGEGQDKLLTWEFGKSVEKKMLRFLTDYQVDFTDLKNGMSLNVLFDKSQPGNSMWTVEMPVPAKPEPLDDELIEEILTFMPEGGAASTMFVPNVEWQLKQFAPGGKCSGLNLPLHWLDDEIPASEPEQTGPGRNAAPSGRGSSTATTRQDFHVAPGDDIEF